MKGWVYFARFGDDGPIKIGRTGDPRRRVDDLSNGSPIVITLLGAMLCERADLEEVALHKKLAPHRVKGEWFSSVAVEEEMKFLAGRLILPSELRALCEENFWRRSCTVQVRVTEEESERWKEAAFRQGLSFSEWARKVLEPYAAEDRPLDLEACCESQGKGLSGKR